MRETLQEAIMAQKFEFFTSIFAGLMEMKNFIQSHYPGVLVSRFLIKKTMSDEKNVYEKNVYERTYMKRTYMTRT
jgi:hypothetical protein